MQPTPSRRPAESGPTGRLLCGVCRDPAQTTTPVSISSGDLRVSFPLCERDAAGLMKSVDSWLAAAEATATANAAQGRRLLEGEAVTVIREWALGQGYPVARSGSLSQSVIAAYRRAHSSADARDATPDGPDSDV